LFFGTLTSAFYYQYPYQVWQDLVAIKCWLHFFLNRMHVPVSLRANDFDEQRQALAVFYNSLLSGGSFPIPQASDACAIEGKRLAARVPPA